MYDDIFSKLENYQIRQVTHKVGCQPGDCIPQGFVQAWCMTMNILPPSGYFVWSGTETMQLFDSHRLRSLITSVLLALSPVPISIPMSWFSFNISCILYHSLTHIHSFPPPSFTPLFFHLLFKHVSKQYNAHTTNSLNCWIPLKYNYQPNKDSNHTSLCIWYFYHIHIIYVTDLVVKRF